MQCVDGRQSAPDFLASDVALKAQGSSNATARAPLANMRARSRSSGCAGSKRTAMTPTCIAPIIAAIRSACVAVMIATTSPISRFEANTLAQRHDAASSSAKVDQRSSQKRILREGFAAAKRAMRRCIGSSTSVISRGAKAEFCSTRPWIVVRRLIFPTLRDPARLGAEVRHKSCLAGKHQLCQIFALSRKPRAVERCVSRNTRQTDIASPASASERSAPVNSSNLPA